MPGHLKETTSVENCVGNRFVRRDNDVVDISDPFIKSLRPCAKHLALGGTFSMSAMGHEQTSRHARVMSVLSLKADIPQRRLAWSALCHKRTTAFLFSIMESIRRAFFHRTWSWRICSSISSR